MSGALVSQICRPGGARLSTAQGRHQPSPAERRQRVKDYIGIWGPFGRNLHEDLLAVTGQGRALAGVQSHILHAREEEFNSHDEIGMRHFYAEWSRRMGRSASDPYAEATPGVSGKHARSTVAA